MLMRNTNRQQQAKAQQAIHIREEHTFKGPMPCPEDLAKYNQIVPGAAERILKMAEDEMKNRHKNEKRLTLGTIWSTIISIVFAFIIAGSLAGLSFYLAYKGFASASASVAIGSIAAVISVFLYKSKSRKRNESSD